MINSIEYNLDNVTIKACGDSLYIFDTEKTMSFSIDVDTMEQIIKEYRNHQNWNERNMRTKLNKMMDEDREDD